MSLADTATGAMGSLYCTVCVAGVAPTTGGSFTAVTVTYTQAVAVFGSGFPAVVPLSSTV